MYKSIKKAIDKSRGNNDEISLEFLEECQYYYRSSEYPQLRFMIGKRSENFYYAHITQNGQISYMMSRYLDWNKANRIPVRIPKWIWLIGYKATH